MKPIAGECCGLGWEGSKILTGDLSFPGELGGKEICREYRERRERIGWVRGG